MEQFGGFARKTTEELFIQSFFESSTKSSPPALTSAENLGPSPVTDPNKYARGDSEELFSSWINSAGSTLNQNTETNTGATTPGRSQRARPVPRRVSGELAAILKQQNNFNNNFTIGSIDLFQRVDGVKDVYAQPKSFPNPDNSLEATMKSRLSNGSSKQSRSAPDLFQSKVAQKMWFDSQAPVTRSRSSELRRRFVESGTAVVPRTNLATIPVSYKEPSTVATEDGWTAATHALAPIPTSDPSSSQPPPVSTSVSDYVGMLKGSLNRAKLRLGFQPENHVRVSEDMKGKKAQNQGMSDFMISPPGILDSSSIGMKQINSGSKWPHTTVERHVHMNTDNINSRPTDESYVQQSVQVPKISDSSGGTPNLRLEISNEIPCTSGQTNMMGRSKSLKRANAERDHNLAEPFSMSDLGGLEFQGSVKNQEPLPKVPDSLRGMGSINSAAISGASLDSIDVATKKRRVDRHRKMTEAKGRGFTSVAGPPDLQAAVKRLDELEKDVRSLRMTLSFMNRKDSEQTKHIEELEKKNKELERENKDLKRYKLSMQGCDVQM
nr:hypothetical protein PHYPA_028446 [Physcomitrium patens]